MSFCAHRTIVGHKLSFMCLLYINIPSETSGCLFVFVVEKRVSVLSFTLHINYSESKMIKEKKRTIYVYDSLVIRMNKRSYEGKKALQPRLFTRRIL